MNCIIHNTSHCYWSKMYVEMALFSGCFMHPWLLWWAQKYWSYDAIFIAHVATKVEENFLLPCAAATCSNCWRLAQTKCSSQERHLLGRRFGTWWTLEVATSLSCNWNFYIVSSTLGSTSWVSCDQHFWICYGN